MNIGLFAHPLSFRDRPQAQADWLAAHGVDGVRLAFSYHSGRWLLTTSDPCAVADFRAGGAISPRAGVASAIGTGGLSSAASWGAIGAGVGFIGSGISAMDEC
ncbi:hypothetical protein [Streptomyces chryseus]